MEKSVTVGACVKSNDAGLKLDRIVYGAAVVSGLAAGFVGRSSPGLAELAMYLCWGAVVVMTTLQRGVSPWKAVFFIAFVYPLAAAPVRLIGVAIRELGGMSWNCDMILQALSVGWITLGVALLTVKVLVPRCEKAG